MVRRRDTSRGIEFAAATGRIKLSDSLTVPCEIEVPRWKWQADAGARHLGRAGGSHMRAHIARNHPRPGDPAAAEDAMTAIALVAAVPRHQAHD
jgi:hypothetical protein